MNKHNARDYLPLVQALAEGKTIQIKTDANVWEDREEVPFLCDPCVYRVKPEPREYWISHYEDGLVSGIYAVKEDALKVPYGKPTLFREVL